METQKIYLTEMDRLECDAAIIDIVDGNTGIILNQTVFYAQGGGQPYDTGTIEGGAGRFKVESVKPENDLVIHRGKFEKRSFVKGDKVHCIVEAKRRLENMKYHSAGHVIDRCIRELNLGWKPEKGHHYPEGAYVSYYGNAENPEVLKETLEKYCAKILIKNEETKIIFMKGTEAEEKGFELPPFINKDENVRLVYFGEKFAMPCGGTHVKKLSEIGKISIKKIKNENGKVKISYSIG